MASAIGTCQAAGCGEKVGEKTQYCASCRTPAQRAANAAKQKEIEAENRAKGFKV